MTGPRSLWLQEALRAENGADSHELVEDTTADVCIVGGGYTGLWTALRVKELEPDADVVLLEQDICGGGPSGRNGGFALTWWSKIQTLIKRTGEEEAFRLAKASEEAVREIGAFCEREGIDAHFHQGGWLWTATAPAQMGAWQSSVETAEAHGEHPYELLTAEEVQVRTGSPIHLGAAFEKTGAIVQPALLARGLRRVALERGVRIFERTPMVELDRERGIVRTPSGSVEAGATVLALNAWATKIPELARAVVAVSSDMVATAPMPELLRESGWTGGEAISDCRLLVHYYRPTRDGRVAFGRGGGRLAFGGRVNSNFDYNGRQTRELEAELVDLVPAARGVAVTHAWGGPIDRTTDGLPICGSLPTSARIVYGTGFSGNGVAPSLTVARILASSALRRDDEWSASGLNRGVRGTFPPEPIRFVGGLVVRGAVRRKEGREDRERSVDPVTRALAGLAPQGFFRRPR
ncbi:MAG TPA: FAD-dependent oxidoreductase [Gaiellaceae bacterium]|nr:FAD-dependent oxidoreductase [Gaiellaceae bacterium]